MAADVHSLMSIVAHASALMVTLVVVGAIALLAEYLFRICARHESCDPHVRLLLNLLRKTALALLFGDCLLVLVCAARGAASIVSVIVQ
jgi:hypothetical protein